MNNERALFFVNEIISFLPESDRQRIEKLRHTMQKDGRVWKWESTENKGLCEAVACMSAELERDIKTDEIMKQAKSKGKPATLSAKSFSKHFASLTNDAPREHFKLTYVYQGMQCIMSAFLVCGVYTVNETLPIGTLDSTLKKTFDANFSEYKLSTYNNEVPIDDLGVLKAMLKTVKAEAKSANVKNARYVYTFSKTEYGVRMTVRLNQLIQLMECIGGEVKAYIQPTATDLSPVCLKSDCGNAILLPVSRVIKRGGKIVDDSLEVYANEHTESFVKWI